MPVTVTFGLDVKLTAQLAGKAESVTEDTHSEPSASDGLAVMFRPKLIDVSSLPVVEPETVGWSACGSTMTRKGAVFIAVTPFSLSVATDTTFMSSVPLKLEGGRKKIPPRTGPP